MPYSVRTFWTGYLESRSRAASLRWLKRGAATIRLTAKRSIRKNAKPSQPGEAPHTGATQYLRNAMAFDVDETALDAAIGVLGEGEFAGRLEDGGGLDFGEYQNTETGEVFWMDGAPKNSVKWKPSGTRRRVQMERRPFLAPAADKMLPRVVRFWLNSIR